MTRNTGIAIRPAVHFLAASLYAFLYSGLAGFKGFGVFVLALDDDGADLLVAVVVAMFALKALLSAKDFEAIVPGEFATLGELLDCRGKRPESVDLVFVWVV